MEYPKMGGQICIGCCGLLNLKFSYVGILFLGLGLQVLQLWVIISKLCNTYIWILKICFNFLDQACNTYMLGGKIGVGFFFYQTYNTQIWITKYNLIDVVLYVNIAFLD
jgi:hypothetical protein